MIKGQLIILSITIIIIICIVIYFLKIKEKNGPKELNGTKEPFYQSAVLNPIKINDTITSIVNDEFKYGIYKTYRTLTRLYSTTAVYPNLPETKSIPLLLFTEYTGDYMMQEVTNNIYMRLENGIIRLDPAIKYKVLLTVSKYITQLNPRPPSTVINQTELDIYIICYDNNNVYKLSYGSTGMIRTADIPKLFTLSLNTIIIDSAYIIPTISIRGGEVPSSEKPDTTVTMYIEALV